MTQTSTGIRWTVTEIVSVTDGDTVRLRRSRVVDVDDELDGQFFTSPTRHPRGVAVRLPWVDTPEKDDHDAWVQARRDTASFLAAARTVAHLELIDFGPAGFDRILGDVGYVGTDGTWVSLAQWLMRERGWPAYIKGA